MSLDREVWILSKCLCLRFVMTGIQVARDLGTAIYHITRLYEKLFGSHELLECCDKQKVNF